MENTEWFGVVRWCDEDIRCALDLAGFEPTIENVSSVRRKCEHHSFTDAMIERGWEVMEQMIWQARQEGSIR